ncbi:ROK family protein [Nisaea sediminum]|uniref:ROK family protein n=1 Tax=Nisaea sediminum TaxID=2775867 RepID=UPI001869447A|nr:ROK family protein [Nisaea sediminum]
MERDNNRTRVLRLLRRHGAMPRVELGRRTGLSPGAISTITSDLISDGILREAAEETAMASARGRPPVNLVFNPDYACVAAASMRMGVIDAVIADFQGNILAREMVPCTTRDLRGEDIAGVCAAAIETVAARVPGARPATLGMAVQGIVDPVAGRQLWSPILNIRDIDVVTPLVKRLQIPVVIENDSAATALAVAGSDGRLQEGLAAVLMIGHGVGMGLLQDGGPFPGTHGFSSEIGHVRRQPAGAQCRCGQRGCIEAYLADYALYRDARSLTNLPITSNQQPSEEQMESLVRRAEDGDAMLQRLFDEAGTSLADAVRVVASVLAPHRIAIAGSGMRGFHLMKKAFEAGLSDSFDPSYDPLSRIVIADGGAQRIVEGMVQLALQRLDTELANAGTTQSSLQAV